MNISKDVYEYITKFTDDKTIVNMLSVNKTFRKEEFFKRILERKYLLLIEFKEENQTWKDFYLKTVYYLYKLRENYGIPYISTKGYNPKTFYRNRVYKDSGDIINRAMFYAAEGGHIDIVQLMIQKGATDFNRAMEWAACGGYMDIVKLMVEKGAIHFNWAMYSAERRGHIDIVNYLKRLTIT